MHRHIFIKAGIFVFIVVLLVYIAFASIFINTNINSNETLYGIFGDTIGGTLNPILTFITFIALLYSLSLQQEELKATREELSRSADAQEKNLEKADKQINAQELAKFENTFFSLLNHHTNILNTLNTTPPAKIISQGSKDSYQNCSSPMDSTHYWMIRAESLNAAREYLLKNYDHIDHYLCLVHEILKFIENNHPSKDPTKRNFSPEQLIYSSILRASINHKTLEIICINGASDQPIPSHQSYKELIEKTAFLEHLNPKEKIIQEAIQIYKNSALGNNIHFK